MNASGRLNIGVVGEQARDEHLRRRGARDLRADGICTDHLEQLSHGLCLVDGGLQLLAAGPLGVEDELGRLEDVLRSLGLAELLLQVGRRHGLSERASGCKAHISAVAQHDCAVLKLSVQESALLSADAQLAVLWLCRPTCSTPTAFGRVRPLFVGAHWNEEYWPLDARGHSGPVPEGLDLCAPLSFDAATMTLVDVRRSVVYDAETLLPIAVHAAACCPEIGEALRTHCEPLASMPTSSRKFNLARTREGFRTEAAGIAQRMEMVGGHLAGRNKHDKGRPTQSRPTLGAHVVNPDGDLCSYVNLFDEFDFWGAPVMMQAYSGMASVLRTAFPCGSAHTAGVQSLVDTDRRCFTDLGFYLEPSRVLGECIGISAGYAAAIHNDPTDFG